MEHGDLVDEYKQLKEQAQVFKEAPFFKEFGNAIDKIVDRISVGSSENEISQFIQFESATSIGGNEYLPLLLEAIQRKKQIWFLYTSYIKAEEKPRKVSPLFLKEYRNRWYLISYDINQKDIRTYALDRIDSPKLLEEETYYPGDFNAENYFKHSMGITSYKGKSNKIIIKANTIAARYIKSQPIHESQEVKEETKDFTLFVLTLLISEELIRTILSYGGEIEIVEPAELRNAIQDRISGMNKLYKLN